MHLRNLLLALSALGQVSSSDSKPQVSFSKFDSIPKKLVYFPQSPNVVLEEGNRIWISQDQGKTFNKAKGIDGNSTALVLVQHPFDLDRLMLLSKEKKNNYWSTDRGSTWKSFGLEFPVADLSKAFLAFHATDPNRVIIQVNVCREEEFCRYDAYYTLDFFETPAKLLLDWTNQCEWAQSINPALEQKDKIYCTQWPVAERNGDSVFKDPSSLTLVTSNQFFANQTTSRISLGGGIPILGLTSNWLIGIVKKDNHYSMVTTKDGINFAKSSFYQGSSSSDSQQLVAFSVLESSNNSLVVDVVSAQSGSNLPKSFGSLYVSNSDGRHFVRVLDHTNRDLATGLVDFEHIQSSIYEGIQLANTVKNWKEIDSRSEVVKKLTTFLSFNNGRNWTPIQPPKVDVEGKEFKCSASTPAVESCSLHLHSITTTKNVGKVFSVTSAPGTIVGVGSVGDYLLPYEECDTFISHDSGISWIQVQKGPFKFETLNFGTVIVLIPDKSSPSREILYSKNGGKEWEKLSVLIEDSEEWIPKYSTLDSNSTSLQMVLVATKGSSNGDPFVIHLNFEPIFSRKCSTSDLELYKLASPDKKCVLGGVVSRYRRKSDADCYMDTSFDQGPASIDQCECSDTDLECDTGFKQDSSSDSLVCIPDGPVRDQPLDCKEGDSYDGLSGYRLIPGDTCKGVDLKKLKPVSKKCQEGGSRLPDLPVSHITSFDKKPSQIVRLQGTDTTVMLVNENVWYSRNQGESWNEIKVPDEESVVRMVVHETKKDRIFLYTDQKIYVNDNAFQDEQLTSVNIPVPYSSVFDFHPFQADWYAFTGIPQDCPKGKCLATAYITKDGGKSFSKLLDKGVSKFIWARKIKYEMEGIAEDSLFSLSRNDKSADSGDNGLYLIESDGKSKKVLDLPVVDFFILQNVLLVATNTPKDPILYASIDGKEFSKTTFPPIKGMKIRGLTVLDTHPGGIFLDILQDDEPESMHGILFKSTADGKSFTRALPFTNHGTNGKVDVVNLPGVDGVVLANTVSFQGGAKLVETKISNSDGATWTYLNPPLTDSENSTLCDSNQAECRLQLHLQSTDEAYRGMVMPFGTSKTAGLILAVGNVGSELGDYNDGDLFMTRDAGRTWKEVKKGPQLWAIVDQGSLLVLADNSKPVDSIALSWDFGFSWQDFHFSDQELQIQSISAHEGSTKIMITGTESDGDDQVLVAEIDFSKLLKRSCDREPDFEKWTVKEENSCFLGQEVSYLRRKTSSVCLIGPDFIPIISNQKTCECTSDDFECDVNFFRNEHGECTLMTKDPDQPETCLDGQKYTGASGYRKLSISTCSGGSDLTKKVERACDWLPSNPENVNITSFVFDSKIDDFVYLKKSKSIVAKDSKRNSYISKDNGMSWSSTGKSSIIGLLEDNFNPNRAFLISTDTVWIISNDNLAYSEFHVPNMPNINLAPSFLLPHPTNPDWYLWIGANDCTSNCHTEVFVSWNAGQKWESFDTYVSSCKWGRTTEFNFVSDTTIFCSVFESKSGEQRSLSDSVLYRYDLHSSPSPSGNKLLDTSGFAIEAEYLIVASPNSDDRSIDLEVSLDGSSFKKAEFPDAFQVRDGYTVLDSLTGNLFLHVIESLSRGSEYGTIFKSNWDGSQFKKSLEAVNQNQKGFVDFEKIEGINGTIIANRISNYQELSRGASKMVETKISIDDGESWSYLAAPTLDSKSKKFKCSKNCERLHLHAFTERHDKRDAYSSSGAIGLLIGVGNVGEHLKDFNDGDMFLSRDGGQSWIEIVKEAHMVEIGDHGNIILMVNDEGPVSSFSYSLDQGLTFIDRDFKDVLGGEKMRIQNIITEPSGTSTSFVLFGKLGNDKTIALHVDFSHVWNRKCIASTQGEKSDFDSWSIGNQSCIFGAKLEYSRRKTGSQCFVGDDYTGIQSKTSCECTTVDYECDVNYFQENGKCVPLPNLSISSPKCVNGFTYEPTGYVKRKISQCFGGVDLAPLPVSCGGGSGVSWILIMLILLPITAIVFYVLSVYLSGGMGRYGSIRLPLDTEPQTVLGKIGSVIGKAVDDAVLFFKMAWFQTSDWVSQKVRRSEGYQGVSTYDTIYDPDMPTQNSFETLHWGDDE